MSYKLEMPYTETEKVNFIVEHNHNNCREIVETDDVLYALEKNEIMVDGEPMINPNYSQELFNQRKILFNKEFFLTSLGWIRRNVSMKDGSKKDFLGDLLLQIKAGLDLGLNVSVIAYKEPDFSNELTNEYMNSLQETKLANQEFIQECLAQTVKDFQGEVV